MNVRVLHAVASGGQGRVYAAVLVSTLPDGTLVSHPVALKRPHHLDVARFAREATVAAGVVSAHVVPVLGVVDYEGSPSLVLPWVEGVDLATLLREGALPPRVAVRIVLDAAQGLAALHTRGVSHRDVAPDNVLVGVDGIVRVGDLGLARAHDHKSAVLSGKAAYVSPESIRGEAQSARSDVFVLAAILVECILGRPWFLGQSDAETLDRVLHRAAPDALEGADLLVSLVARALDKTPAARPADATEFGAELLIEARTSGLLGSAEEVTACVQERCGVRLATERARRDAARTTLRPAPATAAPASAPSGMSTANALALAATVGCAAALALWVGAPPAHGRAEPTRITHAAAVPLVVTSAAPVEPEPVPVRPSGKRAAPVASVAPLASSRAAAPNPYRKAP